MKSFSDLLVPISLLAMFSLSYFLVIRGDLSTSLQSLPTGQEIVFGDNFPRTLMDAFGHRITLHSPPKRIVSSMLAADEILLDLLPPDRIAAITPFASDPGSSNCHSKAMGIPQIPSLRVESILSLQPDLILTARFSDPRTISQLRQCQLPIFCFGKYDSLDNIRSNVLLLGQAVGEEHNAQRLANWMDLVSLQLQNRTQKANQSPWVLYYSLQSTAGKNTLFSDLLRLAGGKNIPEKIGLHGHQPISSEMIIALNPEVIILPSEEHSFVHLPPDRYPNFLKDPLWQKVQAVQNSRVYSLPRRHLESISHHVVKAAVDLAHALHPNLVPPDLASKTYSQMIAQNQLRGPS